MVEQPEALAATLAPGAIPGDGVSRPSCNRGTV